MASISRILSRCGFTRCTNGRSTMSHLINFSDDNVLLQRSKLSLSFAGHQRYFCATQDERAQGKTTVEVTIEYSPNINLKVSTSVLKADHLWESTVRLDKLRTKLYHWCILMEQEYGEPPNVELQMSVRRKILELEGQIAPELEDPRNVIYDACKLPPPFDYQGFPEYTEAKWMLILKKKGDLRVKRLLALMSNANVSQDIFCKILATFTFTPSNCVHKMSRPLTEYTPEEIENCLQHHFDKQDDLDSDVAIKSITHVLMKV